MSSWKDQEGKEKIDNFLEEVDFWTNYIIPVQYTAFIDEGRSRMNREFQKSKRRLDILLEHGYVPDSSIQNILLKEEIFKLATKINDSQIHQNDELTNAYDDMIKYLRWNNDWTEYKIRHLEKLLEKKPQEEEIVKYSVWERWLDKVKNLFR